MSGDIDELSRMLGEMQSDISHIRKSTDLIDTKVDKAHENVIELKASAKSAHKRIDALHPHVEDYKKMKQRGIGMMASISAFMGFLGAALMKGLNFFLGG